MDPYCKRHRATPLPSLTHSRICGRLLALLVQIALLASTTTLFAQNPPPPAGPVADRPEKVIRGWPFLYKERGPGDRVETDALFSLYHDLREGPQRSGRIAPFYFYARDDARRTRWSVFFPFYLATGDGDSWALRSLPVAFGHEAGRDRTWWQVPLGLGLYRGNTTAGVRQDRLGVWPFFDLFARESHAGGQAWEVLGLGSFGGPAESFLPFFRYRRQFGETKEFGLFPFWHYRVSGVGAERQTRWWLPALGYLQTTSADHTSATWLPLFARYRRTPDSHSWSALFGAWAQGHDGSSRWTQFDPLFSYSRTETSGRYSILRVFGREWSDDRDYRATTILWPLGSFASDRDRYQHRFAPFYFAAGGLHEEIPNASYRVLFPFYYGYDSPLVSRRLYFPLYYSATTRSTSESGATSHYGSRILFPFYWHEWEPRSSALHVLPLYSHLSNARRDLRVVLGPLYVRHERFATEKAERTIDHSVLWPFFGVSRSASRWHLHAAPLVWMTREPNHSVDLIAPFYLRVVNEGSSHHWFVPVYGNYRHESESGLEIERDFYAGGVVTRTHRREPAESAGRTAWNFLGPIGELSQHPDIGETHSRLLPFWWRTRSASHSRTLLFPFFYRSRDGRGDDRRSLTLAGGNLWVDHRDGPEREFGLLYPLTRFVRSPERRSDQALLLYGRSESAVADGPATRRLRLSPFFATASGPEAEPFYHWLHLYSTHATPDSHRLRVMPFLLERHRSRDTVQWDALGGLFRHRSAPQRERLTWLAPFYFSQQLGPTDDPDQTRFGIVPFYYRAWDRTSDTTTTAVLFPFFRHSSSGDGKTADWSLLWPIVEARRNEDFRSTRVFPLFDSRRWESGARQFDLSLLYRSKITAPEVEVGGLGTRDGYFGLQLIRNARGANTHTVAVHPFVFGYHRDRANDSVRWENFLFLNRYSRRGDDSHYSVLGLVHGSHTAERSWHSTFPLYFSDSYREGSMPSVSLPGLVHLFSRQEDRGSSRWSLLGYLAHGRSRKGSLDSEFRVLYRGVAWIRRGSYRERVIEPLFTYENDAQTGESYLSFGKLLYIQRRSSRIEGWRRYLLGIPLQW